MGKRTRDEEFVEGRMDSEAGSSKGKDSRVRFLLTEGDKKETGKKMETRKETGKRM